MDLVALRSLYENKRYQEVWSTYLESPSDEPEWHLLGALSAYHSASTDRDILSARTAVMRAFGFNPEGIILIRCKFLAGELNRLVGDAHAAREYFTACIAELDHNAELRPAMMGYALYNLSVCEHQSGLHEEALATAEKAIEAFTAENMHDMRRQALQNAAWIATELEDYHKAHNFIMDADNLIVSTDSDYRQRIVRAFIDVRQGNGLRCNDYLQVITDTWDDVPDDVAAYTGAIMAEALIKRGHIDEAAQLAGMANQRAWTSLLDSRCMNYTARVQSMAMQAKFQQRRGN